MPTLKTALQSISEKSWSEIRRLSVPLSKRLANLGWMNNKYYQQLPGKPDGCVEHLTRCGKNEIPYKRDIFAPSKMRFGLGDQPVAYFSNDFAINCCETIKEFRDEPSLSWECLSQYLDAKSNPTPGLIGYPISVKLSGNALILDLVSPGLPFLDMIVEHGPWQSKTQFLDKILLSREPSVYLDTQEISNIAHAKGFHGICYQSVRAPIDIRFNERNLVVFDRAILLRSTSCA